MNSTITRRSILSTCAMKRFLIDELKQQCVAPQHSTIITRCRQVPPPPSSSLGPRSGFASKQQPPRWRRKSKATKGGKRSSQRAARPENLSRERNQAAPRQQQKQQRAAGSISLGRLPYGMKRVDYSKPPPPWPLPPHPPPRKNVVRRWFPLAVGLTALAGFGYIYFNQDEGIYEYWRQVEQGNVPLDPLDDEDDLDGEEDEDEDEWSNQTR